MTNKFKLLILDFDGTVGDSRRLITDTMLQTIDALGLETRTREQCARMIGLPLARCFTEMIPMTEEMGEKCAATYREFFKENNRPGAVTLFPGGPILCNGSTTGTYISPLPAAAAMPHWQHTSTTWGFRLSSPISSGPTMYTAPNPRPNPWK